MTAGLSWAVGGSVLRKGELSAALLHWCCCEMNAVGGNPLRFVVKLFLFHQVLMLGKAQRKCVGLKHVLHFLSVLL